MSKRKWTNPTRLKVRWAKGKQRFFGVYITFKTEYLCGLADRIVDVFLAEKVDFKPKCRKSVEISKARAL